MEPPKRADTTMDELELGKAPLSNHRDMPPPRELGVNPHAQVAYMGDPSQGRALEDEAGGWVPPETGDGHRVTFFRVEGYLPSDGPLAHQVQCALP